MLCLAIHIYENGNQQPTPSIRIPLAALATIAKFVPAAAAAKLKQRGINIQQIVHDATTKLEPGILLDLTDDEDRIVIAIEHWRPNQPLQLTSDAHES